jgi:hypothetical protein
MKNILEFQQNLFETFCETFKSQYEDKGAFVVCRTKDAEEYKNSNKSMYSWYNKICNAIFQIFDHWEYKISDYDVEINNSDSERLRMLNDCKNAENVIMWAFENIPIR